MAGLPAQVFNTSLLAALPVAIGSAVLTAPYPFTAESGFCGAQCGSDYVIYIVAEDEQQPPNRQENVYRERFAFDCAASQDLVIYENATETCTQPFLVGRARPSLSLAPGSTGFPSGPVMPLRGSVQRSFEVGPRAGAISPNAHASH